MTSKDKEDNAFATYLPGNTLHENLHPTVQLILNSALHVLCKYGHAGFTMRRVAAAASISVGNLTYHFPNKHELLQAVISTLVADYSNRIEAFLTNTDIPKGLELESIVRWLFMDSVTEEAVHVARELWAMSLYDEVIQRAVDDFYDDLMENIVQMLLRRYPKADIGPIRELVQILAIMSEGTIVLYGTRKERAVKIKRVIELATPLLKSISPHI
jgi:AcrR family transcriptional regulator